jgi:predicted MPP superfamily phosphohydrolase
VVRRETFEIEGLSSDLEGLSILHLSDFHEGMFGKAQKNLLKKINSLSYSVIVFTGDIMGDPENKNYKPLHALLSGVEKKENLYFVLGNHDPEKWVSVEGKKQKSGVVKVMEKYGGVLLEETQEIPQRKASVSVSNIEKGEKRIKKMSGNLAIGVTHYPVIPAEVESGKRQGPVVTEDVEIGRIGGKKLFLSQYDLVLSGHYHGGQYRLPFYGALYVPDLRLPRKGLFPKRNWTRWFTQAEGMHQYISAGLGISAPPILHFRLFCPPEINLITFQRKP